MWEHFNDLPFEVFCTDTKGVKHLISRHRIESEAANSMNAQNRSGGYAAEYQDWRVVELSRGSSKAPRPVDVTPIHVREVRCMLCNDCGMAQPCPGCQKVDPYLKAYSESLVNDETGNPNS
jgi:hypothetical protein